MRTISAADFDKYSGDQQLGEALRDDMLIPAIKHHNGSVAINLNNGYRSLFLHEIFSKLITHGINEQQIKSLQSLMVFTDDSILENQPSP
jgi:hypothetical protein